MGRKYVFHEHNQLYFVSFATVNWIDVFVRRIYFEIMVDSLKHCIKFKGLELYAWCIMPSPRLFKCPHLTTNKSAASTLTLKVTNKPVPHREFIKK